MKRARARFFLERILTTRDDEMDCAGMMEVIDRYVEVEALGRPADSSLDDVPEHTHQCPDCGELVATLAHLVRLEDSGALPEIDALWSELRSMTDVGAGRGARIDDPVADPPPLAPVSRRDSDARWYRRHLGSTGALLVPAALVAALLMAGAGWARSEQRARAADRMFQDLSRLSTVRSVRLRDGSSATVFFSPDSPRALIHLGAGGLGDDAELRCWMTQNDGARALEETPCGRARPHWWFVVCEEPMANYDALALTVEPDPSPVVQVSLSGGDVR